MEWSNEIIKVLDNLGQKFGVAIDWTQQNVVPYVQQLLNKIIIYKLSVNSFGLGISILFIIISSIYLYKSNKNQEIFKWENYGYESGYFVNGNVRAIISIVLILISVCVMIPIFFVSFVAIIKCLTLPELVIYEFIKGL